MFMEQHVHGWSNVTRKIFNGVLLFSIASIIVSVMGGISWFGKGVSIAAGGYAGVNIFTILMWLFSLCAIAGYVLYMVGLGEMRTLVSASDSSAVGNIRMAVILMIISMVIDLFGVRILFWIGSILEIIAAIMMMVSFSKLRKSETMSEKARSGFSQLFVAMLLIIIGVGIGIIFGWIPILGYVAKVLAWVAGAVGFIMTITGWTMVKNSPAPML